jgi:hypothetical protein
MDDHWCLAATATQQQHHKGVRRPSPAKGLELWINRAREGWMPRWQRMWLTTKAETMQLQSAAVVKQKYLVGTRSQDFSGYSSIALPLAPNYKTPWLF